jgi:uncharacterized protein
VTSSPTLLQPVRPAERIDFLDVLRGFALLGILLMNIEAFVGPLDLAMAGIDPRWQGVDRWADALSYVLVQGKFYPLFSLLFGMGFAVMAQRAEAVGREFAPLYLRRSAALLVIGLIHGLLIWSGDILFIYALLSCFLLAFREVPRGWLPVLGVGAYMSAVAMIGALGAMVWMMSSVDEGMSGAMQDAGAMAAAKVEQQRQSFGSGTYMEATAQRARDLMVNVQGLILLGPEVFGMFLLGMWFVRSGVIQHPDGSARLFAGLRWAALPAGLVLMLISVWVLPWIEPGRFDLTMALAFGLATCAGLLMSLGYLGWVSRFRHRLGWLAPAGRMALTNYLLQSLVCTLVFYGYGLGWFEQAGRAWQILFAVTLFAVQVVLSHCWLRHFQFGPVEWLWRAMTYGRLPPMRRASGLA